MFSFRWLYISSNVLCVHACPVCLHLSSTNKCLLSYLVVFAKNHQLFCVWNLVFSHCSILKFSDSRDSDFDCEVDSFIQFYVLVNFV